MIGCSSDHLLGRLGLYGDIGVAPSRLLRGGGLASSAALFAQNNADNRSKLTRRQKKEIQTIVKIVDDAAAGQPAPNDCRPDVAARRPAEGAGQQGIRAVHA